MSIAADTLRDVLAVAEGQHNTHAMASALHMAQNLYDMGLLAMAEKEAFTVEADRIITAWEESHTEHMRQRFSLSPLMLVFDAEAQTLLSEA